MLCDSTRVLLQTILQALQAPDQTGWDDHMESGKECLYEMHQMSRASFRTYLTAGSDKWPSHAPDGAWVTRALPHVKAMVSAIRRQDRVMAVESGKAALASVIDATKAPARPKKTGAEAGLIPPASDVTKSGQAAKARKTTAKRAGDRAAHQNITLPRTLAPAASQRLPW
jgi:hypothetical protein